MHTLACSGKFSDEDEARIASLTEKYEKFETINQLRSKLVTTLETKIEALFLVKADNLPAAIDAIALLIRRHATLSYMKGQTSSVSPASNRCAALPNG